MQILGRASVLNVQVDDVQLWWCCALRALMGAALYCGYISCLCACNASHPRDTQHDPGIQSINSSPTFKISQSRPRLKHCTLPARLPHHRPSIMLPLTNRSHLLNTCGVLLAPARYTCPYAFASGDLLSGLSRRAKQRRSAQPVYMANFLSRLFGGGNSTSEKVEVCLSICSEARIRVCAKLTAVHAHVLSSFGLVSYKGDKTQSTEDLYAVYWSRACKCVFLMFLAELATGCCILAVDHHVRCFHAWARNQHRLQSRARPAASCPGRAPPSRPASWPPRPPQTACSWPPLRAAASGGWSWRTRRGLLLRRNRRSPDVQSAPAWACGGTGCSASNRTVLHGLLPERCRCRSARPAWCTQALELLGIRN